MENIKYSIVMHTPIGLRYGTINICQAEGQIKGTLDILNHSEPFSGTLDSEGNCTICGRLVTLMRNISYTAIGSFDEKTIELLLQGERNKFKITGIAVSESEVDI